MRRGNPVERPRRSREEENRTAPRAGDNNVDYVLTMLTLLLPLLLHTLEMNATNPCFCPPTRPPIQCTPCLDIPGPLSVKVKEPTPEMLWLRSAVGTAILEFVGLVCYVCRIFGRREAEKVVDAIIDALPREEKLIYLFGRVIFSLDRASIVDTTSKFILAVLISLYLVSFATVYASPPSLKKILKVILVSNCCICAELWLRLYCWEAFFSSLFLLMFMVQNKANLAAPEAGDAAAPEARHTDIAAAPPH